MNERNFEHLLTLARKGKNAGSSGTEKQARKLVQCLLANAVGLDSSATAGIDDVINIIQNAPQDGRDLIRGMIQ